jgi:cardiolipin synthase A/B
MGQALVSSGMHWHWTMTHSALAHGIFIFAGLLTYVSVTRMNHQRRYPSAAIGWVMAIVFMPYLGIPLFLLLGSRKILRPGLPAATPPPVATPPGVPAWSTQVLTAVNVAPPAQGADVAFYADGGEAQVALLAVIARARERIDLCTFILADDASGNIVVDALVARAREGVHVRVLLDTFGCMQTPHRQIAALRNAGAEVHWFSPFFSSPSHGRTNLRNHRKMTIADGVRLWSGGRNLAAEYFTGDADKKAWVDLSFVVSGPVVAQAQSLFDCDWASTNPEAPAGAVAPASGGMLEGGVWTQLIASGPDQADDTLYALLVAAANQARTRILLATPYCVPGEILQYALCMAARRGVRVALLLPEKSNHRLADLARERDLRELVHAGAEVYMVPYMTHAKAVVVDEDIALCGSANLDGRSLLLNYELMMAFYAREQIAWLASWFSGEIARGRLHHGETPGFAQDVLQGVVRAVGFQL